MVELAIRPASQRRRLRAGRAAVVRLRALARRAPPSSSSIATATSCIVATNADGMTACCAASDGAAARAELLSAQLADDASTRSTRQAMRAAAILLASRREDGGVTTLRRPAPVPARWLVTAANRFIATGASAIERAGFHGWRCRGAARRNRSARCSVEPARRDAVDWSAVEFFWGDERAVPPDHPESNFGVAYLMLISQLPNVRPDRVHRMQAEAPDLDAAALAYETELDGSPSGSAATIPPAFDLIWLGMGPDGHTASLFPGSPAARRGGALGRAEQGAARGLADDPDLPGHQCRPRDDLRRHRRRQGRCARPGPRRQHVPAGGARDRPGGALDRRRGGSGAGGLTDAGPDLAGGRDRGRHRRLRRGVARVARAIGLATPATLNAERYLAWRGRASPPGPSTREGMTGEERRRIYAGVALAALAVAALVAFFATS